MYDKPHLCCAAVAVPDVTMRIAKVEPAVSVCGFDVVLEVFAAPVVVQVMAVAPPFTNKV